MSTPGSEVVLLDPTRHTAWNEYVGSHPQATVFHGLAWKDILEHEYGFGHRYLAAIEGGRISGVLPLFRIHNLAGRKYASLPLSMYGGPIADNADVERHLLAAAEALADQDHADIDIRMGAGAHCPGGDQQPVEFDSRIRVPDIDPEQWLAQLQSAPRRSVRRARKHGLEARTGSLELLDDFYLLLGQARRRLGLPLPRKAYYRHILGTVTSGIITVYNGSTALSTCLYLLDARHLHYAVPALGDAGRSLGAGDLCAWEILQRARESGRAYVCMGGSPVWHTGLIAFKKRWGSQQIPIYNYPATGPARGDLIKQRGSRMIRWLPPAVSGLFGRTIIRLFY